MKRAVLYLRVSTIDQTTANQERGLCARSLAAWAAEVAKVYKDHGISGAKASDKASARPRHHDAGRQGHGGDRVAAALGSTISELNYSALRRSEYE